VKDIISGFFMLVENQFAVGDIVEAAGKTAPWSA
jgi:small-conductance mechanosensitive channel